jgi:hypothetical protein
VKYGLLPDVPELTVSCPELSAALVKPASVNAALGAVAPVAASVSPV